QRDIERWCHVLLDHSIRSCQHVRRNCEVDLLGGFEIYNKLKPGWLLHRQVGRLCTFESLVDVVRGLAVEISVVLTVGHEATYVDKLLLKVNSRQPVLDGELDDPLSFGEK